ncbi:Transcription elongation factor (TFIIS) family protein [Striga hermonthica]|uniref:Transcription elongation factor (TFIIS) family protein n=1 Tax=Striga hermonthica TaxID=68872 RepID=A0A9N7R648_STRHE|nr:Transcription elongation factor (TFIIS) family protein [Striga hermonthica]
MTLDDFFTLTEMNNGLTAPSRVNELVSVMQKQKDHIVKNVNEATRQWSAVGSAIVATDNQECLDLFVRLDGLRFLGCWLKEAHKFGNDPNNSFLEESVARLLQALERLRAGHENLVSSEVWTAVEDLQSHSSAKVRDKARALFDSWKMSDDKEKIESSVDDDKKGKILSGNDQMVSTSSDVVHAVEENLKSDNISDSLTPSPNPDLGTVNHSTGNDPVGLCNPAKIGSTTENLGSGEENNASESKPEVALKSGSGIFPPSRDKSPCGGEDIDEKGIKDEAAETEISDHKEQSHNSSEKPDLPKPESRNKSQAGEKNLDKNPSELGREETNIDRSLCDFDLNQDMHLDDTDRRISTPVPIVSSSRAAAARGPPSSPLQFEGNLGLKITASASAFRPASPRQTTLSEKQPQNFFDIDLNSSGNTEAGGSQALRLDLNLAGEDGPARPTDRTAVGINLNDRPAQNFDLFGGGLKVEDSVISIMGKRVEVDADKGSIFAPITGFPNGRAYDVRTGTVLGVGSVIPYTHYGNNDVGPGPSGPAVYGAGGPVQYVTDSRGAPVPQILGTPASLPASFSQTPPFFLNLTGPSPSNGLGATGLISNGPEAVGPSRGSLDLNSGMGEGGSRNPVGFMQFLSPSGVGSVGEQQKLDSQPTMSSAVGGKRKEPDTGWENYPFNHYTSPWK